MSKVQLAYFEHFIQRRVSLCHEQTYDHDMAWLQFLPNPLFLRRLLNDYSNLLIIFL